MLFQHISSKTALLLLSARGLRGSSVATSDSTWMIDPATPLAAASLGADYKLVFSDEFNQEGRNFDGGRDARWRGVTKPAAGSAQAHFYNASGEWLSTGGGALRLRAGPVEAHWMAWLDSARAVMPHSRPYTSAMLSGWNQVRGAQVIGGGKCGLFKVPKAHAFDLSTITRPLKTNLALC